MGLPGSITDCGVFNDSNLEPALHENTLGLPPPDALPNDNMDTPYFLVGDNAFALRKWMMKPFSHRFLSREEPIFNYRTSRARRVSENGFGILAAHWRCLLSTMHHSVEVCTDITKACLCLHNLMRDRYPMLQNQDVDGLMPDSNIVPDAW